MAVSLEILIRFSPTKIPPRLPKSPQDVPQIDVTHVDIPGVDPQIDDTHVYIPGGDANDMVDTNAQSDHSPQVPEEAAEQTTTQAHPKKQTPLRRSTRVKTQTRVYIPSMSGSKYSYAVTQLQSEGVLDQDAHMGTQNDFYQTEPDVVAAVMTQLSLKAGLKEWCDKAYEAAESEMKQLHFRNAFEPMHWRQFSHTQRKTVLESHMFLKEKRDGETKGRTWAGRNQQRDYVSKKDASSPTVTTESVLLICITDAKEERDAAVIGIPNAFIQTRVEDDRDMAIIEIHVTLVDILIDIAPDV
jgi:hypothetical protein